MVGASVRVVDSELGRSIDYGAGTPLNAVLTTTLSAPSRKPFSKLLVIRTSSGCGAESKQRKFQVGVVFIVVLLVAAFVVATVFVPVNVTAFVHLPLTGVPDFGAFKR
jgi:hypothetical protein